MYLFSSYLYSVSSHLYSVLSYLCLVSFYLYSFSSYLYLVILHSLVSFAFSHILFVFSYILYIYTVSSYFYSVFFFLFSLTYCKGGHCAVQIYKNTENRKQYHRKNTNLEKAIKVLFFVMLYTCFIRGTLNIILMMLLINQRYLKSQMIRYIILVHVN